MAFGNYEHCWACVNEIDGMRRRGEEPDENHPAWVGYKAFYVGEDDLPDGISVVCDRHAESEARARAIRAVVAAQWGVACILNTTLKGGGSGLRGMFCSGDIAALPTAEQIVDGAA